VAVWLGLLIGVALTASGLAGLRLVAGHRRVLAPESAAMQSALHAAAGTLPHLRRGLSPESAAKAAPHLRTLTQAETVAVADRAGLLALDGPGRDEHLEAELCALTDRTPDDRVHVEPRLERDRAHRAAVLAPLVVQGQRVGTLIALYPGGERLRPEDTRVVAEAASLVSAQVELSAVSAQEERLARAELRALRAQISPHFVYNALAAVAGHIHSDPEEARELLTEFAEFTRYAFRTERPYVTLADELQYVEKYLRLERARFGERLEVRVQVAPEVLGAVVPVLSLQPLVENAVRHGVEARSTRTRVEILGRDLGGDVELRVRDEGLGMDPAQAEAALNGAGGGVGLANVNARMTATFGVEYALAIETAPGQGTIVVMTVPKFRAGVRAA
jgi:two-component system LytT family sensor kinase